MKVRGLFTSYESPEPKPYIYRRIPMDMVKLHEANLKLRRENFELKLEIERLKSEIKSLKYGWRKS